jgi:hypothetical protein
VKYWKRGKKRRNKTKMNPMRLSEGLESNDAETRTWEADAALLFLLAGKGKRFASSAQFSPPVPNNAASLASAPKFDTSAMIHVISAHVIFVFNDI